MTKLEMCGWTLVMAAIGYVTVAAYWPFAVAMWCDTWAPLVAAAR